MPPGATVGNTHQRSAQPDHQSSGYGIIYGTNGMINRNQVADKEEGTESREDSESAIGETSFCSLYFPWLFPS